VPEEFKASVDSSKLLMTMVLAHYARRNLKNAAMTSELELAINKQIKSSRFSIEMAVDPLTTMSS